MNHGVPRAFSAKGGGGLPEIAVKRPHVLREKKKFWSRLFVFQAIRGYKNENTVRARLSAEKGSEVGKRELRRRSKH